MIEQALVALLTGDTTVHGIVGDNVRPFADANTVAKPALTYWRNNTNRPYSNDGPIKQAIAQFQLDAWAVDATTCFQLLDAVRQATDGKSGAWAGVDIDFIHVLDQQDQINLPSRPGVQKGIQRSTMQLVISYTEA